MLTAGACYFAVCSVLTFLYGMYRYRLVLQMIEQSKDRCHNYNPDKVGVVLIVTLVLIASAFGFALIFLQPK